MASQLDIFSDAAGVRKPTADLPEGFRYQPGLIGHAEEQALLARVQKLPFRDFEFHGYRGRRLAAGEFHSSPSLPPSIRDAPSPDSLQNQYFQRNGNEKDFSRNTPRQFTIWRL